MKLRTDAEKVCAKGYYQYGISGNNAVPGKYGVHDPGLHWAWYTGVEANRTGRSLERAIATLYTGTDARPHDFNRPIEELYGKDQAESAGKGSDPRCQDTQAQPQG